MKKAIEANRMSASQYVVYGPPISLFTRKLESAMLFYGAPFERADKTAENGPMLESRSGSHQVPILTTPENWMLADTTPILDLLDSRFPHRRLFPEGPNGVLVHVVEEILDEWIARTMVHYRWHYDENTRAVVSQLLDREVSLEESRAFPLAKWGPRACRATGTESLQQQKQVEIEYLELMAALELQLATTRYALGDRPTAADTILLGGLRAHTNADPIPNLSAYARVCNWDDQTADEWKGDGELAVFPDSTPFANHVLELGRTCYSEFVLGNAEALRSGDKAFTIETYGEDVSYLTRPYPEQSRRMVQARIRDRLSTAEHLQVGGWLESRGLVECFMP
jgi:glutathione S-transferase